MLRLFLATYVGLALIAGWMIFRDAYPAVVMVFVWPFILPHLGMFMLAVVVVLGARALLKG